MYIHVLVQTTFDVRTTVSSPHSDFDHGPKRCYMHLEDQLTQSPMILEKEETSPVLSSLTAAVLSVRESFFCSFIV